VAGKKGADAYSAVGHSALLKLLMSEPNSFNSSESSPEWKKVHKDMVESYYLQLGVVPRGILAPCTAFLLNYTVHSAKS
jgi:hypothetical protein